MGLIISDLNSDSTVSRLLNIIDEIIAFPQLKFREYESYDSSKYLTLNISPQNRAEIIGRLNTIKTSLESYAANKGINNLQNIILVLGNILREHRLIVRRAVQDRGNSLFHKANTDKNRIGSQFTELIFWRNKTEHPPTDNHGKEQYEEWRKKLDLAEIEKHLKTVYRGLVFDE